MYVFRLFCFLLAPMVVAACSEAPFTHRRQMILVSETQEIAVGVDRYEKALKHLVPSPDAEANRLVSKVGRRLAQAASKDNYLWEFAVIDGPEIVNAWVLPGGKVGVYTGVFPVARDETGLAIILAHEVAHALARHHGEKTSRDLVMEVGGMSATFTPSVIRQGYSLGTNLGLILPFGQVQEAEADYIGLLLAAKAGYDPRAALEVWTRMAAVAEKLPQPPQFLASHPGYETRRRNIEKWLPEALASYDEALAQTAEPLPALDKLERPPPGELEKSEDEQEQAQPEH